MKNKTIKRAEVDNIFKRLAYLAIAQCPTNWIEIGFNSKFDEFKKVKCLDKVYEVFFKDISAVLERLDISVHEYVSEKPHLAFPILRGETTFSKEKFTQIINSYLKNILSQKDKPKVKKFLEELDFIENGEMTLIEFKQANIFRVLFFRSDPLETRKAKNILAMLLVIYAIHNKDVLGDENTIERLKMLAKTYVCIAGNVLGKDIEKLWKELNSILGSNYKEDFSICKKLKM